MAGDLPVKASGCAMPADELYEEAATTRMVRNLLDAFSAVLQAEESLLAAALHSPAAAARDLIEGLRASLRESIEVALSTQASANERAALLAHAIDFDGHDGPLAKRAARALAAAVSRFGQAE